VNCDLVLVYLSDGRLWWFDGLRATPLSKRGEVSAPSVGSELSLTNGVEGVEQARDRECGDCKGWAPDRIGPHTKNRGHPLTGPSGMCLLRGRPGFAKEPACSQYGE